MIDALYNGLILPLVRVVLWAGQVVSPKLRERITTERKGFASAAIATGSPRILFHASSMGELEQVLPIMHQIKEHIPECCIFYSCSSPSGYNHAVRQSCIDISLYLPIDTRRNVKRFLASTAPDLIVINRYDVWPNFVRQASERCEILLINATYPSVADSPFLRSWVTRFYSLIDSVVAVSEGDAVSLQQLCRKDVKLLPDTRIDRVLERITHADQSFERLRVTNRLTLMVGSSWQEDEDLVIDALGQLPSKHLRLIIVPHEPTESALRRIEEKIACTRLSRIQGACDDHIVVDSIGKLLSLYAIADAAFVGGGFGAGVHSTTEPVGYGIPVACGPHVERSRDARELMEAKLVTVVSTPQQLRTWLQETVLDLQQRMRCSSACKTFVSARKGSSTAYSTMILSKIKADTQ